jgi:signal transduction histidine kinase
MLKFVDYKDLNQAKSVESLAEFKTLHSLPDSKPIAIVDKSCRMIYVNNSFFEIFGIKENGSVSEIETVPDLERTVIGLFKSQFSNLNMEIFLPNDNSRTLMLDAERVIISNEEYILLIFNTVQQKITLEGRINTLHQALEYSDIPVLITDANGKVTYATASFEKILDLSLDVIYNNSLSSVFSMHLGQDDISRMEKAIRENQKWSGSISFEDNLKNISFLDLTLIPISRDDNQSWAFILSAHDITHYVHKNRIIKKSERRLKSIINNISDLLLILSKQRNKLVFLDANENFSRVFQVDRSTSKKKNIENIFDKEFTNRIYEAVEKLPKESSFDINFEYESKENRHYKAKMTEIEDNLENEKLFIISLNDDTERTQYEEQLKKAYEKELHLNMLKTTFLENMSHEIRTPANAIMGYSEIIEDSILEGDFETVKEITGSLKDVLARILNLFNNIVEVSEIEAGEITIEKETLDCNKVLRSVHSKKLEEAKKKGLNFYLVFEKGGLFISADWVKLEKIIHSLVDNAIKYTKAGEVVLISRSTGRKAEIVISDSGDGINKSQLKKILEPFTQEEEVGYSRNYEGAGLGLTLAYSLTKLMGGEFHIQSEKRMGTKITLVFPVAKPSADLSKLQS